MTAIRTVMASLRARVIGFVLVAIFAAAGAVCLAQTPVAPVAPASPAAGVTAAHNKARTAPPRFRSGTNLVALDVCVQNRLGQFVGTLQADDFLVLEDNVPQKVTFFSSDERMPLAVVLLIDQSQSMAGEKLERAKAAAAAFVRTLERDDLVEILAFNELANRLYPLGADHVAAQQSVTDLSASGMTGLYEAVLVGVRDLEQAQRARPAEYQSAIVILSDGEDTRSRPAFEDVLEDARRSGIAVHSITLPERDHWLAPAHELAQLAFDTGGHAVAVRSLADLASIYENISEELRHQYRLAYVSSATARDGGWRRISVRLPKKEFSVRTRGGYYAPRAAESGTD